MTTMHTSFGRYQWTRLTWGPSSAPEEFQARIATTLEDLEGIVSIADDILVYGVGDTYEEACIDHDRHLRALMERCLKRDLKLNEAKFLFRLKEVKFMCPRLTQQGMKIENFSYNRHG